MCVHEQVKPTAEQLAAEQAARLAEAFKEREKRTKAKKREDEGKKSRGGKSPPIFFSGKKTTINAQKGGRRTHTHAHTHT